MKKNIKGEKKTMNSNVPQGDILSAFIAGTISFVLFIAFKVQDALEELKDQIEKGEKEEGSTIRMELMLWSASGIIVSAFGAMVFFGILYFKSDINLLLAYIISGFVAMNGIGFLKKFHKKAEEKIEEL